MSAKKDDGSAAGPASAQVEVSPSASYERLEYGGMKNWSDECIRTGNEDESIACLGWSVTERVIHLTRLIVRHEHQAIARHSIFRDPRRRMRLLEGMPGVAVTTFTALFLLSPAFAQEQKHAYSA